MTKKNHIHPTDVCGVSRLAIDATLGITDLGEAMHHTIARTPGIINLPASTAMQSITGLVYDSIREITRLVGGGLDAILAPLIPLMCERH